jgi:hypothetical protein
MRPNPIPTSLASTLAAAAALLLGACTVDKSGTTADAGNVPVTTPDGGDAGADDAGAGGDAGPAVLGPPAGVGLAVVATPADFSSTRISLVAANGTVVNEDCIHSQAGVGGGSSLTISGDVIMPSQPQRGNDLWIVDRGNAALLVLDPATCAVRRQMSVSTGFRSNPHDVVVLSDAKAYVPRFEKNLGMVDPTSNAAGDDVLVFHPGSGAVLGRIALSAYAAPVDGATIQARPDRAVIAAGKVFVTLASQDARFATTGEGRIVVIDPATDAVTATIALTGLESCSGMDVLPGGQTLYVACSGAFGPDQPVHSGVALIDLSADPPAVARVISAEALNGQPINFLWVAAASATNVFAGVLGSFDPVLSDWIFGFDPGTGRATEVTSADAYNFGRAVVGGGRLYVSDGTPARPRVRVFDVSAGGADPPPLYTSVDFDPAAQLLPREVAWY